MLKVKTTWAPTVLIPDPEQDQTIHDKRNCVHDKATKVVVFLSFTLSLLNESSFYVYLKDAETTPTTHKMFPTTLELDFFILLCE